MDKKEYYKISEDKKLPMRCSCLNKCARYRYTALFIGNLALRNNYHDTELQMRKMNILGTDEVLSNMLVAGEPITMIGGNSSFYISNACPEFFLNEHEHKLTGLKSVAVHSYSYDEHYKNEKYIAGESRHYSECAEFSLYSFNNKIKRGNERKTIPYKVIARLQKEISSKCPFCENECVEHFDKHHIDENRNNNDFMNLIMLCKICHSKITKGDISMEEVIIKKNSLQNR